jgi:hypothetical protein
MKTKRNYKPAPKPASKRRLSRPTNDGAGISSPNKIEFAPPDIEADRKAVKDYFFNEFLPEDFTHRGEDEEAEREATFSRLTKLAVVVDCVNKKNRKRK